MTIVRRAVPEVAGWEAVCAVNDLIPDRGVAAMVDGAQVAVFLLTGGEVLAIDNLDPFSGASVLSRGIVGDLAGEPTVASPVYKQRFNLRSGRCIDDDTVWVSTWVARVAGGCIEVARR
ncbi:MAG: nitrite reductase small subunit NirD [Microthrixaceae bacterium]